MIKRIKIRDFKSIRELDLELDPVTVLVGRSGSGKSNFVQALRFLRNLLLNFQEATNYEGGWHRIVPIGLAKPETTFDVRFSIPGSALEYNYQIKFGMLQNQSFPYNGQPALREERLSLGNQNIFSRSRYDNGNWFWQNLPNVVPEPSPGGEIPMLGSFPSLRNVVLANAAIAAGVGYYHFPASTLGTQPPDMRGHIFSRNVPGLSDAADNYLDVVRTITQDFHHPEIRNNILAALRAINPSIDSVELNSLTSASTAVVGHRFGNYQFDLLLNQESDGFRRFYAHLLALYQTPPKLVLVFEEPENAIFPGALSLLADEFKATPRENRGQVILTTHSPMLLDSFDVENVRTVEMIDGMTRIGRVSKEQSQAIKDNLLTTGELLTVDAARIAEPEPAQKS